MSSDEDLTPKTETQLIAAIYERAQARKRLRIAGAPEVGIFWVVDGKAVILGEPLSEAESWGEFKNYSQGHDREWSRFLQRTGVVPRDRNTTTSRAAALSTTQQPVRLIFLQTNAS
jgi:hypothetical protein